MFMAIAAVSWVYHELPEPLKITGYSLRNLDIKTALRLPEDDYGVEIIFGMELADTASARSLAWASFAISSVARDSNEWTEHCAGLIKIEVSEPAKPDKMSTDLDSRFPDLRSWYKKFKAIGIGYGPTFQPLSKIRADPDQNIATAKVALNTTAGTIEGGESSYPLHPAAPNATFQLGLIACHGGQVERVSTAFLPIHLSQLYLKEGFDQDWGTAIARGRLQGLRGVYIKLQMLSKGGDVVLDLDTLRCISYSKSKSADRLESKAFSSPFTRLAWKPDFRTLNNRQFRELFPPPPENNSGIAPLECTDMIACLIVADIYETFVRGGDGPQPSGDLRHWLSWVKRRAEEDQRENMVEARQLSPDQRRQLFQKLYSAAGDNPEAKAAKRLHENMSDILPGRKTGLDVLVPDDLLTALYETGHFIIGAYPQLYNVMDCLGHANPNLSILEIGAGTDGATRVAMKALVDPHGIKRYADYTFTDISAGFLASAQESMGRRRRRPLLATRNHCRSGGSVQMVPISIALISVMSTVSGITM